MVEPPQELALKTNIVKSPKEITSNINIGKLPERWLSSLTQTNRLKQQFLTPTSSNYLNK